MPDSTAAYQDFYAAIDRDNVYTKERPEEFERELVAFIDRFQLGRARVLEIGSGKGVFQDVATGYVGLDISETLRRYYHPPERLVVARDGEPFPFPDNHFDGAFTYATFEHIPSLENAFRELYRVTRPGGHILFHAAWQVRPWAARGLSARPYRDLSWRDRLEKPTLPLRGSVAWRSLFLFPRRLARLLKYWLAGPDRARTWRIDYRRLEANYEVFWQSDSDACNHIDMHAAILWFLSRGCQVEGFPTPASALRARTGSFIVQVEKS